MGDWNFTLNAIGKQNGTIPLQITREESLDHERVLDQCSGKQVIVVNPGNSPIGKTEKLLEKVREKHSKIPIGIVGKNAPLLKDLGEFTYAERPLFLDEMEELRTIITEAGSNGSEEGRE
jgi:hypothetical protein